MVEAINFEIPVCPEMHADEMHELYDSHNKVSPTLNSYYNTNNCQT